MLLAFPFMPRRFGGGSGMGGFAGFSWGWTGVLTPPIVPHARPAREFGPCGPRTYAAPVA